MADKRQTKRNLKRLEKVKTWQLVILFILAAFVTATFLRLNNIGMDQRRAAVIAADAQDNDQLTLNRLYELQVYSSSHMHASTGDIYLEEKYKRDVKQITEQALTGGSSGQPTINKRADDTCRPQYTVYTLAYLHCVVDEMGKYTVDENAGTVTIDFPSPALYRHSYVSPIWSPDFAGWSVVITAIIGLLIIIRMIAALVLRSIVRYKYKSMG